MKQTFTMKKTYLLLGITLLLVRGRYLAIEQERARVALVLDGRGKPLSDGAIDLFARRQLGRLRRRGGIGDGLGELLEVGDQRRRAVHRSALEPQCDTALATIEVGRGGRVADHAAAGRSLKLLLGEQGGQVGLRILERVFLLFLGLDGASLADQAEHLATDGADDTEVVLDIVGIGAGAARVAKEADRAEQVGRDRLEVFDVQRSHVSGRLRLWGRGRAGGLAGRRMEQALQRGASTSRPEDGNVEQRVGTKLALRLGLGGDVLERLRRLVPAAEAHLTQADIVEHAQVGLDLFPRLLIPLERLLIRTLPVRLLRFPHQRKRPSGVKRAGGEHHRAGHGDVAPHRSLRLQLGIADCGLQSLRREPGILNPGP